MKVFVSGASGFVGRHLARSLTEDGHQVRTLARAASAEGPLAEMGVDVVCGDLADYDAVRRAVAGCEVVYHTAAVQPNPALDEATFYTVNVKGTEHVARAATEVGVRRFVHCSTVAAYGWAKHLPVDELSPTRPDGAYAVTKLRSEEVAVEQCRAGGITVTVARLTRIYGPGDLSFVRIFKDVLDGRFVMIGRGRHSYHLTYVDDIVAGLKACAAKRDGADQCYIIGSDEVRTLREFVETIADEGGVTRPRRRVPALPFAAAAAASRLLLKPFGLEPDLMHKLVFFTQDHAYDISKARSELAFRPSVSLRDGVRRTIAWYRSHGHV